MRPPFRLKLSLPRKISLLFGGAVLLTIIATLAFPWLQMTALNEQAMLLQAKRITAAAFQAVDIHDPDWTLVERQLEQRWPLLVTELGVPNHRPHFVPAGAPIPAGFRREAFEHLSRNPLQQHYWRIQQEGRLFRFAMAIRSTDADPHPRLLRGLIDVQLPMPRDTAWWNAVVTLLAGATGAVLAILVFYVVTDRLVISPVTKLRQATEQVAAGDIEVRATIRTGDEFEQLSEAFNNMLVHLKAAQDEQRTINRSLDVRLGELAETNVALYESNRLKGEFLANVTHELRTPLVSIIGFAELARDAAENPEVDRQRLARFAENILTSGRSLLEIINDLLDVAKIEAGKLELHLSDYSIAELCDDLVDFIRPLADKRNQHLHLTIADGMPPMHSDSGKIKQILYNLLSNAVKFTPEGGSIYVSAHLNGSDFCRLIVRDTGPGIPKEQHGVIFEKFRQLDSSVTREHTGTGLGLAITQDLVALLGGAIHLESESGRGSTFVVDLPITVTPAAERIRVKLT